MSTPFRFFVACRYSTVSGDLVSETSFYTIIPRGYEDDAEGWAQRFFEGHARLGEDEQLVVREVTRSEFNRLP